MSTVADGPVWRELQCAEITTAVSVMQIEDDVVGIEQHK